MIFSTAIARPLQLVTRTLQWSSAVIVMGLTSYFIKQGPKGQHLIYQEVIVCPVLFSFALPLVQFKIHTSNRKLTQSFQAVLSVAFFLPAFISPFLPTALSKFVLLIDVVFSYLYAYIFPGYGFHRESPG
jgi:hypothetical protein